MTSARTTDIPVSAGNLNDGVLQPCKNKFRETRGLLHVVSGVSRGWWPISKNKSKEHQEPPSVPSSPSTPSSFEFVKTEILVGLIVCFAKIPATVAYSFIANIPPDVSLHSSWIIGLFGSIFGGSPGVISGLSGATAAVTGTFVSRECDSCPSEGIEIYFLSILASSLFMAVFTYFRLSSLIQLVPTPVMMGFCNGLAIVIGRGQLKAFQTQEGEWMEGTEALVNSLQCVAAGLIVVLLPKVPKIGKFVPPSAIAIFVAVMLEFLVFRQVFGLSTATVGDAAGFSAETALPTPIFYSRGRWDFSKVSFSGDVVQRILVQGFSLFLVGTVEVLMTVEVVKNMLDTKEPCADQQMFATTLGNFVCGLLGAAEGDTMLSMTVLNIKSGGRSKISDFVAAVGVMLIVTVGYQVLNFIPMAALSGIMLVVSARTFIWHSLVIVLSSFAPQAVRRRVGWLNQKIHRWDALNIIIVTVLTVFFNLALAVIAGVCVAAISFAWDVSQKFRVESTEYMRVVRFRGGKTGRRGKGQEEDKDKDPHENKEGEEGDEDDDRAGTEAEAGTPKSLQAMQIKLPLTKSRLAILNSRAPFIDFPFPPRPPSEDSSSVAGGDAPPLPHPLPLPHSRAPLSLSASLSRKPAQAHSHPSPQVFENEEGRDRGTVALEMQGHRGGDGDVLPSRKDSKVSLGSFSGSAQGGGVLPSQQQQPPLRPQISSLSQSMSPTANPWGEDVKGSPATGSASLPLPLGASRGKIPLGSNEREDAASSCGGGARKGGKEECDEREREKEEEETARVQKSVMTSLSAAADALRSAAPPCALCEETPDGRRVVRTKYYQVQGPVFYGTSHMLDACFDVQNDPLNVVLVLRNSSLCDYSALETINQLKMRYQRAGKILRIKGLTQECVKMAVKANHLLRHVDLDLMEVELPPAPHMFASVVDQIDVPAEGLGGLSHTPGRDGEGGAEQCHGAALASAAWGLHASATSAATSAAGMGGRPNGGTGSYYKEEGGQGTHAGGPWHVNNRGVHFPSLVPEDDVESLVSISRSLSRTHFPGPGGLGPPPQAQQGASGLWPGGKRPPPPPPLPRGGAGTAGGGGCGASSVQCGEVRSPALRPLNPYPPHPTASSLSPSRRSLGEGGGQPQGSPLHMMHIPVAAGEGGQAGHTRHAGGRGGNRGSTAEQPPGQGQRPVLHLAAGPQQQQQSHGTPSSVSPFFGAGTGAPLGQGGLGGKPQAQQSPGSGPVPIFSSPGGAGVSGGGGGELYEDDEGNTKVIHPACQVNENIFLNMNDHTVSDSKQTLVWRRANSSAQQQPPTPSPHPPDSSSDLHEAASQEGGAIPVGSPVLSSSDPIRTQQGPGGTGWPPHLQLTSATFPPPSPELGLGPVYVPARAVLQAATAPGGIGDEERRATRQQGRAKAKPKPKPKAKQQQQQKEKNLKGAPLAGRPVSSAAAADTNPVAMDQVNKQSPEILPASPAISNLSTAQIPTQAHPSNLSQQRPSADLFRDRTRAPLPDAVTLAALAMHQQHQQQALREQQRGQGSQQAGNLSVSSDRVPAHSPLALPPAELASPLYPLVPPVFSLSSEDSKELREASLAVSAGQPQQRQAVPVSGCSSGPALPLPILLVAQANTAQEGGGIPPVLLPVPAGPGPARVPSSSSVEGRQQREESGSSLSVSGLTRLSAFFSSVQKEREGEEEQRGDLEQGVDG